jgi:glycosyltransferase involved in cell wall biosynthesis
MVDLMGDQSRAPLASISCMTYNHAPFIRQCLESLLMQKTNFPFEIVIHDDASTDGTKEIVEEYASRYPEIIFPIIQLENQYSKGVRGIQSRYNYPRCRGRYIAICECDDSWTDPLKLQKQVDFLETHDEYVLTFHDFRIVDAQGQVMDENPLPTEQKKDASRKDLILGNRMTMTLTLCFRNVIKEFPPEKNHVTNGDTFLISMLGNYGKGKWMGDEIGKACYRSHSGGVWSMASKKDKIPRQLNTYYWLYRYYLRLGKFGYAINWYIKLLYVKLTRKAGRLGSG